MYTFSEPSEHFVNLALKIQCHIIKNTILQTAFSAILLTGYALISRDNKYQLFYLIMVLYRI